LRQQLVDIGRVLESKKFLTHLQEYAHGQQLRWTVARGSHDRISGFDANRTQKQPDSDLYDHGHFRGQ
jgi:hypothetical protein